MTTSPACQLDPAPPLSHSRESNPRMGGICCCLRCDMGTYEGTKEIKAPIAEVAKQFSGAKITEWFGGLTKIENWGIAEGSATAVSQQPSSYSRYGTFRADFHHFDRIALDLRGNTHVRGAAFSCPRLKLADMVLI